MEIICLIFIIYYLIGTFILLNLVFNPNFNLTLVNKKTKEEKEPSSSFIVFFCLLWIIYVPLLVWKGVE